MNTADVLVLQRIVLGLITPTPDELIRGDIAPVCSPDGIINIGDVLVAKRIASGLLTLDLTPPVISITSHNNNDIVYSANVTIAGTINDNTASVYVNGTPAAVSNGTYSAGITLGAGPNTIIVDTIDPCQNQSQLQITLNYSTGPTNVSGNITTNTAWSVAGSPYIVGGNLTVNPGITLTVEQGAEIKVGSTYGLIVDGSLIINGTETSPVAFTSNASVKAAGDWQGIKFTRNAGSVLQIDHAVIEYSNYGIQYSMDGGTDSISITNSTIRESLGKGIYIEVTGGGVLTAALDNNDIYNHSSHGVHTYTKDSGSSLNLDITNSRIHDLTAGMGIYAYLGVYGTQDLLVDQDVITNTGDHGIYVHHSWNYGTTTTAVVTGNQITGSKNNGIYLYQQYGYSTVSTTVQGNTIVNGGTYGIHAYAVASQAAYPYSLEISGNTVSGSGTGIYLENGSTSYYSRLDIFNNTLTGSGTGSTYYGIYAYSNATTGDFAPVIMANRVSGYGGSGIYCKQAASYAILTPVIAYNTIQNNGGDGLWLETSATSPAVYNNITGNTGYALNNQGGSVIDARYNFWDASVLSDMGTGVNPKNILGIYDAYDNSLKGSVTYDPWSASQVVVDGAPISSIRSPAPNETLLDLSKTVTGVAYAAAGVSKVEIRIDGGAWTPVTGTNSWSYNAVFTEVGPHTIETRTTDKNNVVQAPATLVTINIDTSLPTTSGTMTSDETWSGAVSLTGDVTVPAGVTLTLNAGTTIAFPALTDDQNGGANTSRSELIVNGSLIINGTETSPVAFTS
ncbi:MAG: right-handed parallel beta-helix repeat-containing protein, partial [bacterium]